MAPLSLSDCIMIICMCLYAILLIRIGTSQDAYFHTPFYIFLITTGICGLVTEISFMTGFRLTLTSPTAWIFKFIWMINHIGAIGAMLGKLFIVVHRHSVLNSAELIENEWTRFSIFRLIALQFSIPLLTSVPVYFYEYKNVDREGLQVVFAFTDQNVVISKSITTTYYLLYIITVVVFTFLTSKVLIRISAIVGEGSTRREILRQQKTMFIVVFFCALSHFIKALHQALWALTTLLNLPEATAVVWPLYTLANGLAMYTSPVTLIICSSKVRRLLYPRFSLITSTVGTITSENPHQSN